MKLLWFILMAYSANLSAQSDTSDWFGCTSKHFERNTQSPEVLNWIKANAIAHPRSPSKVRYIGPDFKRHEFIRFQAMVGFEKGVKLEDLKGFLKKFDLSLIRFTPKDLNGFSVMACDLFTSVGVLYVYKNSDDGQQSTEITATNPQVAMQELTQFILPDWVREFNSESYVHGAFVDAPILSPIDDVRDNKGI